MRRSLSRDDVDLVSYRGSTGENPTWEEREKDEAQLAERLEKFPTRSLIPLNQEKKEEKESAGVCPRTDSKRTDLKRRIGWVTLGIEDKKSHRVGEQTREVKGELL